MKEIIWLMKKILRVTFGKRKNIILYFGLPLVGIFISFLAYGGSDAATLKVGVVNADHQAIAGDTVQFLESLHNVHVVKINESSVNDQITTGAIDCAVILEKGFSGSVLSGSPGHIQIVSIKGAQITGFVKSYLYQYLDNMVSISQASNHNAAAFAKIYTTYQQTHFKLSASSLTDTSKNKDMTYQTIGFLLMIMLMSAGNFSEIILKEKENRTYFRLLSAPIHARKYVLSNIAVSLAVMLVQILVTLFFVSDVFHIEMHVPFWEMAVVLSMFALIASGLTLMIVSFAGSSASASALQSLVSTPTCLISGCFWPVDIMPKAAQKIADFMPQRWILDTISKLQQGSQLGSLYLNFLILFAFAAAFFLIATYMFGRNNSVKNFV